MVDMDDRETLTPSTPSAPAWAPADAAAVDGDGAVTYPADSDDALDVDADINQDGVEPDPSDPWNDALVQANSPQGQAQIKAVAEASILRVSLPLQWLGFVAIALACPVLFVAWKRTDFRACCLPSWCANAEGLDGVFPTVVADQCVLSVAEARAMQCRAPVNTSAVMRGGDCAGMTAPCSVFSKLTVLLSAVGSCVQIAARLCRWLLKRTAFVQKQRAAHMTWFTLFTIMRYMVTYAGCVLVCISFFSLRGQINRVVDGDVPVTNHVQLHYTNAHCYAMTTARQLKFIAAPATQLMGALWVSMLGYALLVVVELVTLVVIARILRPRAKRQFIKLTARDIEVSRTLQSDDDATATPSTVSRPLQRSSERLLRATETTALIDRPVVSEGVAASAAHEQLLRDRNVELCRVHATNMATTSEAQKTMALSAWRDAVRSYRPILLLLLLLFAASCVIGTLSLRQTTLAACCLPASCSNVDGLRGRFPVTSAIAGQCELTKSQAAAMQCAINSTAAATSHPPNCTMITGFCNTGMSSHIATRCVSAGVAAVGVLVVLGLAHPSLPLQWRGILVVFVITLAVVLFMGFLAITTVFTVSARNHRVFDAGVVQNHAVHFDKGHCLWQVEQRQLTYIGAPTSLPLALWATLAGNGVIVVAVAIASIQMWTRFRPRARQRFVEENTRILLQVNHGDLP